MEAWREELYHYGMPKRSGRYPYGSGDRPFQGEGSIGAAKRRSLKQTIKDFRTKKKRQKAAQAARDAKAKKASEAEERQKNLNNPMWLKKHLGELSNDEVRAAKDRIQLENDLRRESIKKMNAGKDYIDLVLGYAKTGIDVYDTVTGITSKVKDYKNKEKEEEKAAEEKKKEKEAREEAKEMSNKDLQKKTDRLNKERSYVDAKLGRTKDKKKDK